MTASNPIVELQAVTKAYIEGGQSRSIFQALNLKFNEGEFVLLLGQSGSGKSTLLNLISGIDTLDEGEVLVKGTAIHRLSDHQRTMFRRHHIGFIFQFFNLIPTLTIYENITLPIQLSGRLNKSRHTIVRHLLESVGLADRQDSFPDRLSGGEQQRVAILRAVAHEPDLLLADEPTGNLDEKTGQHILTLLLNLTKQSGKTLIMATHNPEIIPLADCVYRVGGGTIELIE